MKKSNTVFEPFSGFSRSAIGITEGATITSYKDVINELNARVFALQAELKQEYTNSAAEICGISYSNINQLSQFSDCVKNYNPDQWLAEFERQKGVHLAAGHLVDAGLVEYNLLKAKNAKWRIDTKKQEIAKAYQEYQDAMAARIKALNDYAVAANQEMADKSAHEKVQAEIDELNAKIKKLDELKQSVESKQAGTSAYAKTLEDTITKNKKYIKYGLIGLGAAAAIYIGIKFLK